jgi:hypothetical protein
MAAAASCAVSVHEEESRRRGRGRRLWLSFSVAAWWREEVEADKDGAEGRETRERERGAESWKK